MIALEEVKIDIGSRIADVTSILFDAVRGAFLVQARIYLPGTDGSVRGMIGTYRSVWGDGVDLGAAMRDCGDKLKQKEKEFYRK